MSGSIAQEAVKAAAFVQYVQRNAPGVGSFAGFTSRVTDALQQQAEKAGGVSPFAEVFDQVKDKAPGIAAAGFAHAQGFAEYVAKEAPGLLDQVKDQGGDILGFIKSTAPGVFAGAQQLGDSLGSFFGSQGPDALQSVSSVGGSMMGFMEANHTEVMNSAMSSASAAKDAASLIGGSLGELNDVAKVVASGAAAAVSAVDAGAIQDAAKVVGSALSTAANFVSGDVVNAVASVGSTIVSALDAEMMADAASTAMNIIGTGAAVFPFLLPLQIAMRDIGNAVQQATYNKEAAKMLEDRCTDSFKMVEELAPKIAKICKSEEEQKEIVRPFVEALEECKEFLVQFSGKGFLSHMFRWKREGRSLVMLDKKVTDTLQNLSLRVDGQQIDLQVANAEKLDEVFELLKNVSAGKSEPSQIDPEQLAEVVRKAGAESVDQISSELQGVGFKLEQIEKTLQGLASKLDSFASKVDQLAAEQKDRDTELRNLIIFGQAEARKHAEQVTLAAMRLAAEKGGQLVNEKFCTPLQLDYLAKRCRDLRTKVPKVIIIHPHGIGLESFVSRNGEPGTDGPNGQVFRPGQAGAPGNAIGADGEDGLDGEDGHDGQEGEDGLNGESATDFEVMIEFISEDPKTGMRKYRIEHAGISGKDEHDIEVSLLNSVIIIDGKGGVGGKGGNGGSGGSGSDGGNGGAGARGSVDMDGGSGGNGGNGGSGGTGGLAGNGGNGANGCRVVIHTNDPSVLALIEVDVSAGEGGAPGTHGKPGQGGNPGQGGPGGPAGTITAGPQGEQIASRSSKPGRKGKAGKKGKNGRPAPTKQSKGGIAGSPGSVSFCIYNETGMCESGGTPFRVLFNKKDIHKLYPMPVNFGVVAKAPDEIVIFGQQLQFGPVLPINVGSISAPTSEIMCFLMIHGKNAASTLQSAPFPRIPAENKTRYGELPPNAAQSVILTVPKLSATGFALDQDVWPLPQEWSPSSRCDAKFRCLLKVDGILQKFSIADGDNVSSKEFSVIADIPLQIIPDQSGTGLIAPRSVFVGKNISFHTQFTVRNRLTHASADPKTCELGLLAAGSNFVVIVSKQDGPEQITQTTLAGTPASGSFQKIRASFPTPPVLPGESRPISLLVTIPEAVAGANQQCPEPGGTLFLRAEQSFEGQLAQFTPARKVRLCAPWPPEAPASSSDLLVFVDETFQPADYKTLRSIALLIGFTAQFLDYQHFAEMNNGRLPSNVWAPHKGKATILWMPALPGLANLVPMEDFAEHVRAGGKIVCGAQSTFSLPPDLVKLPAQAFRRAVKVEGLTMSEINRGLKIDDRKIDGQGLVALIVAIFMTYSTEKKLQCLLDMGETLGAYALGSLQADDYQSSVPPSGCCSCGGSQPAQVMPIRKSPFTVRDAWATALRVDLALDKVVFLSECNIKNCSATEALQMFANRSILSGAKTRQVALAARDVFGVISGSGVLDDLVLNGGAKAVWAGLTAQLKILLLRLESLAAEQRLDPRAMGERVKDVDLVHGVKSRQGSTNGLPMKLSFFVALS